MSSDHRKQKTASADYDIHGLIKKRWSPRAFSDKPVDSDLLRQLFDAARWAPSSYNEQPWRFIVATKDHPQEFDRMAKVLNEGNRQWATGAPVLILTLKKNNFDRNERHNRVAGHDVGAAASYLTFEATRHGLFAHQMMGILQEEARELYHIPEGYTPFTMIALGYIGDINELPEPLKKRERGERSRLDIDEIVFRGQWDNPARL